MAENSAYASIDTSNPGRMVMVAAIGPRREPEIALASSSGARVSLPAMSIGVYVFRP